MAKKKQTKQLKQQQIFKFSARLIREARKQSGQTQAEIAEQIGLESPQYISNIERGLCRIAPHRMRILSEITGISLRRMIAAHCADEREIVKAIIRSQK